MTQSAQQSWQEYCSSELESVSPLLDSLGITLDEKQPHLGGERFLMQAVTTTSGKKLILLGTYQSTRAVIKVTSDPSGMEEINHERACRSILDRIKFAHNTFVTPKELLHKNTNGFLISVQEYIEQDCSFLARSTPEQFRFALAAFKAQESAHATTYEHEKIITKNFDVSTPDDYLNRFAQFKKSTCRIQPGHACKPLFEKAEKLLQENKKVLERYGNFLTHTDFVPHNFRIHEGTMYLLDQSSIRFGNKYEGWARFINFMTLYNPELAQVLTEYVANNRTAEESLTLKLMRIYRLGELLFYYTQTLEKSEGDLLKLNQARVDFWSDVLEATFNDTFPTQERITEYQKLRDMLRSDDEKERQTDLH